MRIEIDIFVEIGIILRRWADALDRQAALVSDSDDPAGPAWSDDDLTDLYQAWLQVGQAIRDVARSQPDLSTDEVRPEVAAVRDGVGRIAEILDRQALGA